MIIDAPRLYRTRVIDRIASRNEYQLVSMSIKTLNWKPYLLGTLVVMAVLQCGAFQASDVPELRSRRFVIVDEFGREVAVVSGANGQARLELRNLKNRSSVVLAAEDESSLTLGTPGKDRVRLLNKGSLSALEFRESKGKVRILVGVSEKGKPKMILRGNDDATVWQAPSEKDSSDRL
jgi:hypothetical protein